MTYVDESTSREMTKIGGTLPDLVYPMKTLHEVGHSLSQGITDSALIVVPPNYQSYGLLDLSVRALEKHRKMSVSSNKGVRKRINGLDFSMMDFGAESIAIGRAKGLEFDPSFEQDREILETLENLGYAWDRYKEVDSRADLAVHRPEEVHYIDLRGLVNGVVQRYDEIMKSNDIGSEAIRERFRKLGLDEFHLSMGLNLVNEDSIQIFTY